MKINKLFGPALVALAVLANHTARSDVFNVSTAQELTSALTSASANGAADTINLAAGYYIGNFNFYSTEPFALTVKAADGVSRESVTIDGDGFGRELTLTCTNTANVTVSGITFMRKCGNNTFGALTITTRTNADVLVDNCRFLGANSAKGIGVAVTACRDTTIRNCVLSRDATSEGDGIKISSAMRLVLVERNTVVAGNMAAVGHGLYVTIGNGVSVNITNNTISGNYGSGNYGGGVYVSGGSTVTLSGNTIGSNKNYYCGGVYVSGGSTVTLNGNTISGNSSSGNGAGVGINSSVTVTLSSNTISANTCGAPGGGVWVAGGSTVTLNGNTISGNYSSSSSGGGVYVSGGSAVTFNNNTISGNSGATMGAGICAQQSAGSSITLDGNKVLNNTNQTGTAGGGLFLDGYTIKVRNNLIAQNRAQTSTADGGGMWVNPRTRLDMVNNTVTGNYAGANGGGVRIVLDGLSEFVSAYNNVLFANSAGTAGDDVYISGTGSRKEFVCNDASGLSGNWDLFTGNIDAAPAFADSANGDYHLTAGSPCVNTGTNGAPQLPAVDLDGDPRIAGARVDMGAFEFSNSDFHPADVNANWILEASEFTTYSNAWRNGQLWGATSNSISADYATRAGYLLQSGGTYHNDGAARPLRWKPGP